MCCKRKRMEPNPARLFFQKIKQLPKPMIKLQEFNIYLIERFNCVCPYISRRKHIKPKRQSCHTKKISKWRPNKSLLN
ncbi:hypothetical protein EUGRSUZ_B02280 [Eucalyptus grandis]|uniref:Uncharacterized protein n=2 Tax=Eucalyptus grandis TaxID=71139 RepID=A0ACC3LSL2_EUCGR|nr:hypothetical protein EUGRSUZ_B02280 [Eucalyptus grandis]